MGVEYVNIGIIGDIHGNARALESVLDDLARWRVDKLVMLGDLCFKGPRPNDCLEMISDLSLLAFIQGNTDEWLLSGLPPKFEKDTKTNRIARDIHAWTRERMGSRLDELERIAALPNYEATLQGETVLFVHGTVDSHSVSVPLSAPDDELERHFRHPRANTIIGGHVHIPGVRRVNKRSIANIGSVGLSRDGDWWASYVILSVEQGRTSITIVRVPYDIDGTIRDAWSAGMPWADEYEQCLREARFF